MLIYKITNKINNKIYIGFTTLKSAQCRFVKHLSEARCSNENRYFLNALNKYGKDNFIVEQIDTASNIKELKKKEIDYIKQYKATNRFIGYNLSEGGDGTPGVLKSPETREKIRQKALGRLWSEERKEEHKEKLKLLNIDRTKGKENCMKHNLETSKKVEKYDLNNNLINKYSSITEASKANNINRVSLIRYLNKEDFNKLYKGFKYKKV